MATALSTKMQSPISGGETTDYFNFYPYSGFTSAPGFLIPTAKGAWNGTNFSSGVLPLYASVTPHPDYYGWQPFGRAFTGVGNKQECIRFVTPPLSGSGTISGTLDVIIGAYVQTVGIQINWRLHVWVSVGTTDVVRGTLLNGYEESGSNYWPAFGTEAGEAIGLQAPASLTSVGYQDGDRIIVEIGGIGRSATTATGGVFAGNSNYTLYPTAGTGTLLPAAEIGDTFSTPYYTPTSTASRGQILFSQTLPFHENYDYPWKDAVEITDTPPFDIVIPFADVNAAWPNAPWYTAPDPRTALFYTYTFTETAYVSWLVKNNDAS